MPEGAWPWPLVVPGGLLAGLGARSGGASLGGQPICGLARLSPRAAVERVARSAEWGIPYQRLIRAALERAVRGDGGAKG